MKYFIYKVFRKILRRKNPYTNIFVQYSGQVANDYLRDLILSTEGGLMISKFGTIELSAVCCFSANERGITIHDLWNGLRGDYSIHPEEAIKKLCDNSGFFPQDVNLRERYKNLVLSDVREINVISSYQYSEKYLLKELADCVKVDLDGFYAPFLWKNPWTSCLKDKKVLVVHPFVDSIKEQYAKRKHLFSNPEVLPVFKELILIKAVQSISNNGMNTGFNDWFEALQYMENEIDCHDYDIAIIGCGAYGMDLAAHVKRQGKIAIHLAGWTQMLFGIYGNRWLNDQPKYAHFINDYWVRPKKEERPKGAESVEKGCYW